MNATKITLSLAAVLCVLVLWPNQASAGCSVSLSIGGYIGSAYTCTSFSTCSSGYNINQINLNYHRRLLGIPEVRPCVPVYRRHVWRPDRHHIHRPVVAYQEPAGRVTTHNARTFGRRTTVSRVETRHR
jgi:hypothetical protein